MSVPRECIKAMVDLLTDEQVEALRVILESIVRRAGETPQGEGAEAGLEEGYAVVAEANLREVEAALPAQAEAVLREGS